jgi:hypothetical protein
MNIRKTEGGIYIYILYIIYTTPVSLLLLRTEELHFNFTIIHPDNVDVDVNSSAGHTI